MKRIQVCAFAEPIALCVCGHAEGKHMYTRYEQDEGMNVCWEHVEGGHACPCHNFSEGSRTPRQALLGASHDPTAR